MCFKFKWGIFHNKNDITIIIWFGGGGIGDGGFKLFSNGRNTLHLFSESEGIRTLGVAPKRILRFGEEIR